MKQYIPGIVGVGLIVICIVVMVGMGLVIKEAHAIMTQTQYFLRQEPVITGY